MTESNRSSGDAPRASKRPSFHLDGDSSEDESMGVREFPETRPQQTTSPESVPIEALKTFSSESLYSFSYAYDSNRTLHARILSLKRSIKVLKANPVLLDDVRTSLAAAPPSAFARILSLNNLPLPDALVRNLQTSVSSATLSILGNVTTSVKSNVDIADPSAVDDSLNLLLRLLDDALESLPADVTRSARSSTTSLPVKANSARTASNPPVMLSGAPAVLPSTSVPSAAVPLPSDASELEPKKRRTDSGFSSPELEKSVFEALTMPFIDTPRQTILNRGKSTTTFSSITQSVSTLHLTALPSSLPQGKSLSVTPLQPISSKYATGHAVFTTEVSAPYKILSANDMACLLIGMTQSDMRKRSIVDILEEGYDAHICSLIDSAPDKSVPLCGHVLPIVKSNGIHNLASVWLKRQAGFIVWVFEEVIADKITVEFSTSGKLLNMFGDNLRIFFPQHEQLLSLEDIISSNLSVFDMIPGLDVLKPELLHKWSQEFPGYKYHTIRANNSNMPCFAKLKSYDSEGDGRVRVAITSLPLIAGAIIVEHASKRIVDYNNYFIGTLLGYRDGAELRGSPISSVIPKFEEYFAQILKECHLGQDVMTIGLVVPEQTFRKAAARDATAPQLFSVTGIEAKTSEGSSIYIDVQVRVVSATHISVFVSYSRDIQGFHEDYEMPSQLTLLNAALEHKRKRNQSSGTASSSKSRSSTGGDSSPNSSAATPTDSQENLPRPLSSVPTTASATQRGPVEVGALRREKTINEFDILQKIGEGAYGKVLLVQYTTEPKDVIVVKSVIKERILVDTWTRDRKLGTIPNEIRIMNSLNSTPHDNIVKLIDFFEDDQFYHIEMERHGNPGTDLFDLIELRPDMTEAECKELFRQVTSAVSHIHGRGIIHRDIKDENIVVDEHGIIKLIDFGSAAFTSQGPFDMFVGTMDYAAPEVLSGMPYEGMPQDVWALGILLYTIIYKENPFYNVDEIMEGELRVPYVTSEHCIDLIRAILDRNVRNRPDITTICEHPWLAA